MALSERHLFPFAAQPPNIQDACGVKGTNAARRAPFTDQMHCSDVAFRSPVAEHGRTIPQIPAASPPMSPHVSAFSLPADLAFSPSAAMIYGLDVAVGYLLGSIPFGYFVGRCYGIDIRQHGSGNIGATNVLRVLGKKPGRFVFVCDMLKGTIAVVVALQIAQAVIARAVEHGANLHKIIDTNGVSSPEVYLADLRVAAVPAGIVAAIACILGHNFPVWLRFRGGKGVATTVGVLLGLIPVALLVSAAVWVVVFYTLRYVSLASLLAAAVLPVSVWFFKVRQNAGGWPLFYFSLVATALIFWRHRANISRLLNGTEARFVPGPDPAEPL